MRTNKKQLLGFLFFILCVCSIQAQYGNGYGYGNNNRYGRNRSNSVLDTPQETPKEVIPPTAEEIVEAEMPYLTEKLGLNPFEEAVVSTILTNSIKKRMELRILKLTPEKTREAIEKIYKVQKEELEAGLPEEKYNAFVKLQEEGFRKSKKEGKKKKKEKKKKPKE